MASNSDCGGGGSPRIPAFVRVAWAIAAVTVAVTFPLVALVAQIYCDWELSWQWVTFYSTGILACLFAAFGIPLAIGMTKKNGESKPK